MSVLRLRWLLGIVAGMAIFASTLWLRHLPYSSEPIFYAYLQIVGSLLCFTYAANALVRFRGTHERQTLILAFGFVLSGIIETVSVVNFYEVASAGGVDQAHVPLPWMVSRTLLALLLIAAIIVDRRIPDSREIGREIGVALVVVVVVAYITSAAYLGSPLAPRVYPHGLIPRPADLLPALLFAIAGVGFGRTIRRSAPAIDRAFLVAVWMNVACHIVASQSERLLDAPFVVAQTLRVTSYAIVLGGALLDNARLFDQVHQMAVTDSLTGLFNYRSLINVMEAEIQRSQRTGREFAVLMLDLDGLKAINDRHGHLVGSRAICRLADVLKVHSRVLDTAARYGTNSPWCCRKPGPRRRHVSGSASASGSRSMENFRTSP